MEILITAPYNEEARKMLEQEIGQTGYHPWKTQGRAFSEEELIALLRETGAGALITEHDEVSARVIREFPHLRFIGVCRGTPSNVDVEAASESGIPVFFTPARNAQAVAEMFIANVVTLMRHTMAATRWLLDKKWERGAHDSYLQFKGFEMAGKTIGMVGFGAIGQRIARMVKDFPCKVQFYDPFVESQDQWYRKISLEEVFQTSDIVSVHLPANEKTKGMIDGALLSLMKPSALFVNTSRAAVVKRNDLLAVLEAKKIYGAIIDVFDHEPPDETDYKIIHLPNVLATPHIAGATFEVEDHHADIMNENLLSWFKNGQKDKSHLANRQAITLEK